jgi:hypothetical protein
MSNCSGERVTADLLGHNPKDDFRRPWRPPKFSDPDGTENNGQRFQGLDPGRRRRTLDSTHEAASQMRRRLAAQRAHLGIAICGQCRQRNVEPSSERVNINIHFVKKLRKAFTADEDERYVSGRAFMRGDELNRWFSMWLAEEAIATESMSVIDLLNEHGIVDWYNDHIEQLSVPYVKQRREEEEEEVRRVVERAAQAAADWKREGAGERKVKYSVACLNGDRFDIAVGTEAVVRNVKYSISLAYPVDPKDAELFIAGEERALADGALLARLGLPEGSTLFMIPKQGDERRALEATFELTCGPNWKEREGWQTDQPVREWHGVRVHEAAAARAGGGGAAGAGAEPAEVPEGRVACLDLHDNGLAGPLSSDLRFLTACEELRLWTNRISGPLPKELGQLTALKSIRLEGNQMSGAIPGEALAGLKALEYLSLQMNMYVRLTTTYLAANDRLSFERFTGPIPAELFECRAMKGLLLNNNRLTGPVPPEIRQLTALTVPERYRRASAPALLSVRARVGSDGDGPMVPEYMAGGEGGGAGRQCASFVHCPSV